MVVGVATTAAAALQQSQANPAPSPKPKLRLPREQHASEVERREAELAAQNAELPAEAMEHDYRILIVGAIVCAAAWGVVKVVRGGSRRSTGAGASQRYSRLAPTSDSATA